MIEALVRQGADLNASDKEGWTPLHLAVDIDIDAIVQAGGRANTVTYKTSRLLLSLGANPNVRDAKGQTPRDVVEAYGHEMALEYDRLTSACS